MKQFLLGLCLFFFGSNVALMAQLPDNQIAPNWTLEDINGKEHTLYDYLNQGKTVFLEFTTTWCGDCWAYHNHKHLNRLHENYGPQGTDEVVVIMIEGDLHTGEAELNGIGPHTYGNWKSNTSYPIIDDHSLNELYAVTRWPILYVICPNKRLRSIPLDNTDQLYRQISDCASPWGTNNVSILGYTGNHKAFCQSKTFRPRINIQNEGRDTLDICTVELYVNDQLNYRKTWNGPLAPFQLKEMWFPSITITEASTLKFKASKPNNQEDEFPQYNELADIIIRSPKASSSLTLELHTDHWPSEINWELRKDNGQILYESADYDSLQADKAYEFIFELPADGCYNFEITDSYGNGLANGELWPGQIERGAIRLHSAAGVIWDDANFGFGVDIPFEVGEFLTSQVQTSNFQSFDVFPNPASKQLQAVIELAEPTQLSLRMFNTLGQLVKNIPARAFEKGSHQIQMDLQDFSSGMYWLLLENGKGEIRQQKIVIER